MAFASGSKTARSKASNNLQTNSHPERQFHKDLVSKPNIESAPGVQNGSHHRCLPRREVNSKELNSSAPVSEKNNKTQSKIPTKMSVTNTSQLESQNEEDHEENLHNDPVIESELSELSDISAEMWREGDIEEKVLETHPPFTTPQHEKDPIDYFLYYFDEAILTLIVEQSNLYSTQENIKNPLGLTIPELKAFIGILLFMGVVSLPAIEDYWSMNTRFARIRSHIHFVDNTQDPGTDPYHKVRPVLDHIRAKLRNLEQEATLSADEGMVGYKGRYAGGLRQYLPNKPSSKWGFKFFGLAGVSGMLYDFIFYSGANTFSEENLLPREKTMGVGAMAIIALTKCIKNPRSTSLTFDNWYTGIPLITYLQSELNICSLGTFKNNRMEHCPLTADKDLLRTKERGYAESQVSKTGVVVIKWVDNKVVSLAGTRAGIHPVGAVLRWDKTTKSRVLVNIPRAVLTYNASMGGVDLSDQYRTMLATPTRAKRWYIPLFGFAIDLAISNAFLLYKRDCKLLGITCKFQKLKEFRLAVSHSLMAPSQQSRGRPSLNKSVLSQNEVRRPILPRPVDAIRTDNYNHWIASEESQHRCRYCSLYTRCKCTKCDIYLCFVASKEKTNSRNCFTQFHLQKQIVRKKKQSIEPENTFPSDFEESDGSFGLF
ncbi:hypothetical protein FOCC_FOCC012452 [Frankliniella occidentalis]|nr:hypothetical protein FOCC_FOCC012452 [Frankliniella occidentalis]